MNLSNMRSLPLPLLAGDDLRPTGSPSESPSAAFRPAGTAAEIFARLLDESSAALAAPAGFEIPDDELHREILLPLLPAMLADKAIRQHWRGQTATGFSARIQAHLEVGATAPRWQPEDFEIHVTASYLAGPDAKALADTLLSEDFLRDLTAALMNQVLDVVWPRLPAAAPTPAEATAGEAPTTAEIAASLPVTPTEAAAPSPTTPISQPTPATPVPSVPSLEPSIPQRLPSASARFLKTPSALDLRKRRLAKRAKPASTRKIQNRFSHPGLRQTSAQSFFWAQRQSGRGFQPRAVD